MTEYIIIFLLLLAGSLAFFLTYNRYFVKTEKPTSTLYTEALRDLLDGNQSAAFSKLRQVVAEDTSNLDAYLRLGQILRENKNPQRALQVHKDLTLRRGLSVDQKSAILRQLVLDYHDLNDPDMAGAALKEMIALQPENLWAHARLLELHKTAARWDDAYDTSAAILKLESNKSKKPLAGFKYRQGEHLYQQKEYHKARVLFKEAIGLDPTLVPAYLAVGDTYYDEERYEDAVNFWTKLIAAVPAQGHRVIERLKRTLVDLGRFGEIVDICETLLRHDPRNREARLTLADFHEKKGDLDAAEELLAQVVEESPADVPAIIDLVRIHLEKRDYRKLGELVRRLEKRNARQTGRLESDEVGSGAVGIS
ncbi:MAG TPA: tetratricopeptide repeat protein [Candidatus Deferrimicrobium sp.]|nr:tetratricopeptide repeat protein [Candidatus Deferrimicrobium sp.]